MKENTVVSRLFVSSAIFGITSIFFVFTQTVSFDVQKFQLLDVLYVGGPFMTGLIALLVARKSRFRGVFGLSYLFFGIALFMDFAGESIFIYHEVVLDIVPYPSVADIFYGAFFFLAGFFIVKNIQYFDKIITKNKIIIVISTIITIVLVYSYTSYDLSSEVMFDFYYWYGMIFVLGSSTILGLSIIGIITFENSQIGRAWQILVIGIFINTVADIWYANLEILGEYTGTHVVNSLWFCSWLVICYALVKHHKITQ